MLILIDESKAGGYVLAVVTMPTDRVAVARSEARSWVLPGQPRVHAKSESNARRRELLAAVQKLDLVADLYLADRGLHDRDARRRCLAQALADIPESRQIRLIIERDDSTVSADRQQIIEAAHGLALSDPIEYAHLRASEEPLLAIPDLLAWCWQRGGEFRRRAGHLVAVRRV